MHEKSVCAVGVLFTLSLLVRGAGKSAPPCQHSLSGQTNRLARGKKANVAPCNPSKGGDAATALTNSQPAGPCKTTARSSNSNNRESPRAADSTESSSKSASSWQRPGSVSGSLQSRESRAAENLHFVFGHFGDRQMKLEVVPAHRVMST